MRFLVEPEEHPRHLFLQYGQIEWMLTLQQAHLGSFPLPLWVCHGQITLQLYYMACYCKHFIFSWLQYITLSPHLKWQHKCFRPETCWYHVAQAGNCSTSVLLAFHCAHGHAWVTQLVTGWMAGNRCVIVHINILLHYRILAIDDLVSGRRIVYLI